MRIRRGQTREVPAKITISRVWADISQINNPYYRTKDGHKHGIEYAQDVLGEDEG